MKRQDQHKGFTLIELLVVMAIIVMVSSVTVPAMMRSGFFSGNPTDTAARDLFAQLRGAQVYATTHNVDTAIAYGVTTPYDTLFDVGSGLLDASLVPGDYTATNPNAPVLDSTILVRRMTIQELNQVDSTDVSLAEAIIQEDTTGDHPTGDYPNYTSLKENIPFTPVRNTFGTFQPLPSETCLLTNNPTTLADAATFLNENGLYKPKANGIQGIAIFEIDRTDNIFTATRIVPRITGAISRGFPGPIAEWENRFPAHVFKRSGGLDTTSTKQRITLSMGLLPDQDFDNRFMVDAETEMIFTQDELFGVDPADDPDFSGLAGRETEIIIYKATGRVKVAADDE